MFDHTLRQMTDTSLRKPIMRVYVDQTPKATEARVRHHLPCDEAEGFLQSRYSLINVWRPIGNPAIEFPLAVLDWRTLAPNDFVRVDLLHSIRDRTETGGDTDDRGFEAIPHPDFWASTEGYEVRDETYGVAPNDRHKLNFVKNMSPHSTMLLKSSDSLGSGLPDGGRSPVASCCPHTAFVDPDTPADAPIRRSIEVRTVRCFVFFDEE